MEGSLPARAGKEQAVTAQGCIAPAQETAMSKTFTDHARATGVWLKSKPLHAAAPLALLATTLVIAGITAIPHRHAAAANITPDVRAANIVPTLHPTAPAVGVAPAPAAVQPAAAAPAPIMVSALTQPVGIAAGHVRVTVEQQDQLGQYSATSAVVRSVESTVVDGLIAVKDDGYGRAVIRVIEGHVFVQPVALVAGEITKGAQQ